MKIVGVAACLSLAAMASGDPCTQQVPGIVSEHLVGTCFAKWDPDGAGPEPAMLVAGGTLISGSGQKGVARWTGSVWQPIGSAFNGDVLALCVHEGQLFAAGGFTKVGGTDALRIARWNGSDWIAVGSGFDGTVNALAEFGGELVAGGAYSKSGTSTIWNLGAWDGTSWRALQSTPGPNVYALLNSNGRLIVGGNFRTIGGIASRNIAAFDGTNWQVLGGGVGSIQHTVYSLVQFRGQLIAGGTVANGNAGGVLAWNGKEWFGIGVNYANVRTMAVNDDLLYIGAGSIGLSSGTILSYVASWDSQTWKQVGTGENTLGPDFPTAPVVACLTEFEGHILASGAWTSPYLKGVAKWTGTQWESLTDALVGTVSFIQPFRNRFIVGGNFLRVGSERTIHVMSWTGDAWQPLGQGLRSAASAARVFQGKLVVAGGTPRELPESAGNVNTWDGNEWRSLGGFSAGRPGRFEEYNGELIAAGSQSFQMLSVYAWNGASWRSLGGTVAGVRDLAVFGGRLIVGGAITTASGVPVDNLAGWDGSSWAHVGGGVTGPVDTMVVWNGKLIVGGQFAIAGITPAQNAAAWSGTGDNWTPMNAPERVLQFIVYRGNLLARLANRQLLVRWTGSEWIDFPFDAISLVGVLDGEMATWTTSTNQTIGVHALPRFVSGEPTLPSQPADPIAYCGATAKIFVVADNIGSNTPSYQWRKDGSPLSDGPTASGSVIVGAHGAELTIENVGDADAGSYDVEVENSCGSILSGSAELVPNCCPADLSGNGVVDDADFALFLPAYDLVGCDQWGLCPADFNRDGVVDDRDFAIFAAAYAQMVCE